MPFCLNHKIFFKVECSECKHQSVKTKTWVQKAESKKKEQIDKQKIINSKPKPSVKKVSDKRKELNKEYFKLVDQFKKDNPYCKAHVNEYCTKNTDDPHHKSGRGNSILLLDVTLWLPVCRSCHSFIEANPKIAREKGWSESRLAIDQSKPTI